METFSKCQQETLGSNNSNQILLTGHIYDVVLIMLVTIMAVPRNITAYFFD
jgi:hypothetical protein